MENIALVLFNVVSVILTLVFAQDDFGGGEDAGSELDMESMLNTPGSEAKSDPNAPKPTVKLKTLVEESVSALQQLGFIIGNIKYSMWIPKQSQMPIIDWQFYLKSITGNVLFTIQDEILCGEGQVLR